MPCSVQAEGFNKIIRARGLVAAAASRAANHLKKRRDGELIQSNKSDEWKNHSEAGKIESRRARSNHSAVNS